MADSSPPHPKRSRRSTDATRAQRNRAIVADRMAGLKWADIAARHGLSMTQVRTVVRDHRAAAGEDAGPLGLLVDPNAVLVRVVREHEWAMSRLRELAATADNDSAKVGATRGVAQVGHQLLAMLGDVGLVPRHEHEWTGREQLRQIVRELIEAAREVGLPADAMATLAERIDRESANGRSELRAAA